MKSRTKLLIVALLLILLGGVMASVTQTNGGKVTIKEVRFVGSNGIIQNARLYIPDGVTNENPAPGIVAIHGYINTNETQDGFAIEFARRGFVVLAPDQTGHGYSEGAAFANGFGGYPALAFMHTLDIVDPANIGLEGHSMGGWALVIAASVIPDGYKAIVLEGSSTGTYGAPDGTAEFPRNLALVFSKYDEFSALMWGSPVPAEIVNTDKLKTVFGTTETVVPGKLYGSIAEGTARILYQPAVTHPGDHLSNEAIGYAVDWFQKTLDGANDLPAANQIWLWKEIGNLIALIGMVLLFFPVGSLLFECSYFAELIEKPALSKGSAGVGWWIAALVFVLLPVVTLFPFKEFFVKWAWPPTALFPQNITSQVVVWTTLVGLIAMALFLVWHFALNKKAQANSDHYGLTWEQKISWRKIGKSFLLAFLVVLSGYITLLLTSVFFQTDYRFWVFAVKPLNALQFRITLSYIIPFIFFFLISATILYGQLRKNGLGLGKEMLVNLGLLVVGYVGLLAYQYIPLFAGGTLSKAAEPLWTIIAFQFLPLMSIAALVQTYFYRKTGHVYVGAFMSAMIITWIVVASQAIHFTF
ncbi:MAG: alpha/beta hydrolase [Chloroflexi bacterium HGW-Chloroflexi-10]|nr:MAG: alpha/beta hydrolase [Chloroflexi bacterium HGW-Chloroflexi-10]